MGAKQTTIGHEKKSKDAEPALGDEVNFNHFQALRSIGRGSFGKVCIVQKKDSKKLYAMKYASKLKCIHDGAVGNMLQEQQLLRNLEHPFIVNLRYAFQDVEDVFMVEDLLLGGDLRYHLQQMGKMSDRDVLLYVAELALALDYLRSRRIIHRDVKPDNVLLDEEGRAHLTDFNVAAMLEEGRVATSQCGTQPYIAPEIFECAVGERAGYSFPADWWSLGVTACELLKGKRPFEVPSSPTLAWEMFKMGEIHFSSNMSDDIKSVLSRLICVDPEARLCSAASLAAHVPHLDMDAVLHKKLRHTFVPSTKQLNVDPTYELEELIIESKPIHKKKQRLAKVATDPAAAAEQDEHVVEQLQQLEERFLPYNWESALKPTSAVVPSVPQDEAAVHEDGHVATLPPQPTPIVAAPRADSRASLLQADSRSGSPAKGKRRNTGSSHTSEKYSAVTAAAAAVADPAAATAVNATGGAATPTVARDSGVGCVSGGGGAELPHGAEVHRHASAVDLAGRPGAEELLDNGVSPKGSGAEGRRTSAIVQELFTSAIICSAAMIADYEPPPPPVPTLADESVLVVSADVDEVGFADATVVASRGGLPEPDVDRPDAAPVLAATGCGQVEVGCSIADCLPQHQPASSERSAEAADAAERCCLCSPTHISSCDEVIGDGIPAGCMPPATDHGCSEKREDSSAGSGNGSCLGDQARQALAESDTGDADSICRAGHC